MATIQQLEKNYLDKKAVYDTEYQQNSAGRVIVYNGGPWVLPYNNQPVSQQQFMVWLNASDESLRLKEKAMNDALKAWNDAKIDESKKADDDFKKENPAEWFNLQKSQLSAALTQKTTKYLIWGAVAIVLIIGAIVIYKRKYAA